MKKSVFIFGFVLIVCYVVAYKVLMARASLAPSTVWQPETVIFLPKCQKESDMPLSIIDNSNTICKTDNSIYQYSHSEQKVTELQAFESENEIVFAGATHNYVIVQKQAELIITTVEGDALQHFVTYPLEQKELVYSTLLNSTQNILFISLFHEATSPKEYRSAILVIKLGDTQKPKVTRYNLEETERLVDAKKNRESEYTLLTREMYPFLVKKIRIYALTDNSFTKVFSQNNENLEFDTTQFPETVVLKVSPSRSKSEPQLPFVTNATDGATLHASCLGKLCSKQDKNGNVQLFFENEILPIDGFSSEMGILTLFSTTIDKTVYNCKDFGESPQITLRVCVPQL